MELVVCVFVCRVFGHISYRSDWELVKVDFRQSFPRQCTEEDYESWQLTDLQVTHTNTHRYRQTVTLGPETELLHGPHRERSASWDRRGASGRGRTLPSVSKERVTHQLSALNPVSAQRRTSTGESALSFTLTALLLT